MFEKFDCKRNVKIKNYSTIKIGGIVDFLVFPRNVLELKELLTEIRKNKLEYFILGNGSNVLFLDEGYRGVVVCLKHFNKMSKTGNCVRVGAGTNLFYLNHKLKEFGLSGIEWSYGIPATLGGLVYMNGGSFGHEICEFVEEIEVLKNGKIIQLKHDEICWEYRTSNLKNMIILSVKLHLINEKIDKIAEKMSFFLNQKKIYQPMEFPSLGSVFKIIQGENPIYPAKLIDNLGLKGVKIGEAEVSKKHAGFIINSGNATSADFLKLLEFLEAKLAEVGVCPDREIIVCKEKNNE